MPQLPDLPPDYEQFLSAIKERVREARLRAVAAANQELLRGYWEIGSEILRRQQAEGWGSKVIDRLAVDLRTAFPGVKGFSSRSLKYMRAFAAAWPEGPFVQGGLAQISWHHHLALLDKLGDPELRAWYGAGAAQHGWSRDVLVYQIESQLHERQGRALTNFDRTLPAPDSDLAQELSKSPYLFEWLGLDEQAAEADVERGLIAQVERFLLEMGDGFALVGRQNHLEVAGQDCYPSPTATCCHRPNGSRRGCASFRCPQSPTATRSIRLRSQMARAGDVSRHPTGARPLAPCAARRLARRRRRHPGGVMPVLTSCALATSNASSTTRCSSSRSIACSLRSARQRRRRRADLRRRGQAPASPLTISPA